MNYRKNYYYAITITPPYRQGRISYQYEMDKYIIHKYLSKASNYYVLYPEMDKLRLHWHGIFKMTSFKHWAKITKIRLEDIGFIKTDRLKSFNDHLRYLCYCNKNYYTLKKHMPRIIYRRKKSLKRMYKTSPLDY